MDRLGIVPFYEWLWEHFCEGGNIDMFDIQELFEKYGLVEIEEATEDDLEDGFEGDVGDAIFKRSHLAKDEIKRFNLRMIAEQQGETE